MDDLVAALGLVLALEGVLYALFPEGMQRMARKMLDISPGHLRRAGLGAVLAGVVLVWLVRA